MVRCARYLQIIQEDGLIENAARVGQRLKEGLLQLQADFEVISNVRGSGLFLAFDMPHGESRNSLRTKCWEAGLATLTCGPRSLRFRPPLTFSESDADTAVEILRRVLG